MYFLPLIPHFKSKPELNKNCEGRKQNSGKEIFPKQFFELSAEGGENISNFKIEFDRHFGDPNFKRL